MQYLKPSIRALVIAEHKTGGYTAMQRGAPGLCAQHRHLSQTTSTGFMTMIQSRKGLLRHLVRGYVFADRWVDVANRENNNMHRRHRETSGTHCFCRWPRCPGDCLGPVSTGGQWSLFQAAPHHRDGQLATGTSVCINMSTRTMPCMHTQISPTGAMHGR